MPPDQMGLIRIGQEYRPHSRISLGDAVEPDLNPEMKESGEANVHRTKWAIAFVMMVLGVLLTTQFRLSREHQVPPASSMLRAEEIAIALQATERLLKASDDERDRLTLELERARKANLDPTPTPARDVSALEILAGTIEVQGPGVFVTMIEASEAIAAKARVSDEDVWRVINELLAAGAEAISVNGQRITSVTGIRNVSQRILINTTMISSPIEVMAIGDPVVLETSLRLRGGVIEVLDRWGIKVNVRKSDKLIIAPVRPPVLLYAKPVVKP